MDIMEPSKGQAMRARKIVLTESPLGTLEDQYAKLPSLCSALSKADPGCLAILEKKEDIFARFFYAPEASKHFITLQRPLVCADGGWMKLPPNGLK
jgi:hypothetical protein